MTKVAATTVAMLLAIAMTPVMYLLITGDFPGMNAFYGFEEDSAVVNFLFEMRDIFMR